MQRILSSSPHKDPFRIRQLHRLFSLVDCRYSESVIVVMSASACLAEGRLGRLFDEAEALTLPSVKLLLYEKMEDMRRRVKAYETSPAYHAMLKTKDITEELQDFCASESEVQRIRKRLLRLKGAGGADVQNAHLANLRVDEEGNIIMDEAHAEDIPAVTRQPLRAFEAVQLATLVPQSVAEAIALIPSLAFYDEEDLDDVVQILLNSL